MRSHAKRFTIHGSRFTIHFIAHAGFALTGVVSTMLGAILPILAAKWSLNDKQSGYLLAAQAAGGFLSTVAVSALIKRLGIPRSLCIGFVVMAVGVAMVSVGAWLLALAAVFGYGVGLGIAIPATNILIAEMHRGRRAAALNVLNFTWCIGAILGPMTMAFLARKGSLSLSLFALAFILLIVAALYSVNHGPVTNQNGLSEPELSAPKDGISHWIFTGLISALIFLCVGAESSLSGWIVSYGLRLNASENSFGSLSQSAFWAAMLLGRAAAPAGLRYIAETRLVLFGVTLATAGMTLILASSQLPLLLAGVFITGIGLSPTFPTTIAIFSQYLGAQAASRISWLFIMGNLGSVALPWLIGIISAQFASLRAGLTILLFAGFAMVCLQVGVILNHRSA